jgi:hypothetical protein
MIIECLCETHTLEESSFSSLPSVKNSCPIRTNAAVKERTSTEGSEDSEVFVNPIRTFVSLAAFCKRFAAEICRFAVERGRRGRPAPAGAA